MMSFESAIQLPEVLTPLERYKRSLPSRKEWDRAYQFMSRAGLTRSALGQDLAEDGAAVTVLAAFQESEPSSPGEREDWLCEKSLAARHALAEGRQADAKSGALALQALVTHDTRPFGRQIRIGVAELLRDIGELSTNETGVAGAFVTVQRRSQRLVKTLSTLAAVPASRLKRDYRRLCMALLTDANLHIALKRQLPRQVVNIDHARKYVFGAYDIAFGIGSTMPKDPIWPMIQHHAALRKLQVLTFELRQPNAPGAIEAARRLRELGEVIDTPVTWFETFAAEAAYAVARTPFESSKRSLDYAEERLVSANELLRRSPALAPWRRLNVLRTEIELRQAQKVKGSELQREYERLSAGTQILYYADVSRAINRQSAPISKPAYVRALLTYFYEEPGLTPLFLA